MKNRDKKPESLFKKKGFYVALYSCLGIVMISAAALSFTSLLKNDSPSPINTQTELDYNNPNLGELQPADKSNTQSYLTPKDQEEFAERPTATPAFTPGVVGTPRPTPEATEAPATDPAAKADPAPVTTPAPSDNISEAEQPQESAEDIIEPAQAVSDNAEPEDTGQDIASSEPSIREGDGFAPYTAESPMKWPLVGELAMDFSKDRLIFDATLNQYRTNDNMCIAAAVGTQVKASAAGIVKEIDKTRDKGNTVTIDHGNGWMTIYSELQDGILVSVGEIVKEGQVIGGVGNPAIFNILMGSHLQFAVAKDGEIIDPKTVLANY